MIWTQKYISLPWADLGRDWSGVDCWGLPCLVYREELGVDLPTYADYPTTAERAEVAAVVAGATSSPLWRKVDVAHPFDICLFRVGPLASHVGVKTHDRLMIHATESGVVTEDYTRGRWAARFLGHYRLTSLMEALDE